MSIYGSRCLSGEYVINRTLVIITHLLWKLTCESKWTGVQKYACVRQQCAYIKLLDVYVWGWISLLCSSDMLYYLEYGMCEKLFGSLLSKGLSQSALCDVINVEQHIMSFLSRSRTLRRCWFVTTGVWVLIIVVIKIRIQYFGVLGFYAAWIGGYRHLGTTCLIVRGPIFRSETSVTTSLRCVTSQKSEDLIYIEAEAWKSARMQYFGGPVFVFGKFHILSWYSSELPDGCWNCTFKWRSAASPPIALKSFVLLLTLYKGLNKIRSKYFHILRCDAVCLVEIFHRFMGLTAEMMVVAAGISEMAEYIYWNTRRHITEDNFAC